ncbi:MAG: immunoglobulin domain-containing protein [Culturomica sp.]|jgi:hypothetical protein|nr:immunoglobulin domain-containing protein [Culturomica sp.]
MGFKSIEIRLRKFILFCVFLFVALYVQATGEKYYSGEGDGYILSDIDFKLSKIQGQINACIGDTSQLSLSVAGHSVYEKQWKKIKSGVTTNVGSDTTVLIFNSIKSSDAAEYFCEITDVVTGYVERTDTVDLRTHSYPDLRLTVSLDEIAVGASTTLTATASGSPIYYEWNTGDSTTSITKTPERTSIYKVKAYYNEACQVSRSQQVNVVSLKIAPGPNQYASVGDSVTLTAYTDIKDENITWYKLITASPIVSEDPAPELIAELGEDVTREEVGTGKTIRVLALETAVYEAVAELTGVSTSTMVIAYVKQTGSYSAGENDGYTLSNVNFKSSPIQGNINVCIGDTSQLSLSIAGHSVYKKQWKKIKNGNVTNVGSDTTVLIFNSITSNDAAKYFCEISDVITGLVEQTDTVDYNVYVAPDLQLSVSEEEIALGASTILTVTEVSSLSPLPIYYEWNTGDSTASITKTPERTTEYKVKAYYNEACPVSLSQQVKVIELKLSPGPNQYASVGDSVTLTVYTDIKGENIKWYKLITASPIASEDPAPELIAELGDDVEREPVGTGKSIRVLASETAVYEAVAELTGVKASAMVIAYVKQQGSFSGGENDGFDLNNADFSATIEFQDSYCEGDTVNILAKVKGRSNYSYEWVKYGASFPSGVRSDSSTLKLDSVDFADNGLFYCKITDVVTKETKNSDTINMVIYRYPKADLSFVKQPGKISSVLCYGDSVLLNASISEGGLYNLDNSKYTYNWSGRNVIGRQDTSIVWVRPGVTTDYVVAISNNGCITRDSLHVDVFSPNVYLPSNVVVAEHDMLELPAVTNVPPTTPDNGATIDWYVNSFGNHSGQTSYKDTFRYSDVTTSLQIYAVLGYEGCVGMDSTTVLIKKGTAYLAGIEDGFAQNCIDPVIDSSVQTQIAGCTADSIEFGVNARGTNIQFVWQKEVNFEFVDYYRIAGENVTGARSPKLKFKPPVAEDEGLYRCIVTNDCGMAISDTFALSVSGAPVIVSRLNRNWDVCRGDQIADLAITVKVTNSNYDDLKYEWFKDGVKLTDTIAGINVGLNNSQNEGLYKVKVTNGCGSTTDSTYLPIYFPAQISNLSGNVYACDGDDAVFTVEVRGGAPYEIGLYELKNFNGVKYDDTTLVGTGQKVIVPKVSASEDKDRKFIWKVSNKCGTSTSTMVTLFVENYPVIDSITKDQRLCAGENLSLVCYATKDVTPLSYLWYKDGKPTSVETSTYTKNSISAADAGTYICRIANTSCMKTMDSDPVVVTVVDKPSYLAPGIQVRVSEGENNTGAYCLGTGVKLYVDTLSTYSIDSMRWYFNGKPMYDSKYVYGTDSTELSFDSLLISNGGKYSLRLYNECGVTSVQEYTLPLIEPATFLGDQNNMKDISLCSGDSTTLSVKAKGTQPIMYTWTLNDRVLVENGYKSSYVVKSSDLDDVSRNVYCCEIHNGCNSVDMYYKICVDVTLVEPLEFKLSGGGSYCLNEGKGMDLTLSGSDTNYTYRLYRNDIIVETVEGNSLDSIFGPIVFKDKPAGTYYATAQVKDCEFQMEGVVVIKSETAPRKYNITLEKDFCNGTSGAMLSMPTENNDDIRYSLFRYIDDTIQGNEEWESAYTVQSGTGGKIEWTNIQEGTYKVVAENVRSGCTTEMNPVTITKKELPRPFTIDYVADSVYCFGSLSNVSLTLSGNEGETNYTLIKNDTLNVVTSTATTWPNLGEGTYKVKATNKYNCEVTFGSIEVFAERVPKPDLGEDLIFCKGDSTDVEWELNNLSSNVSYRIAQDVTTDTFVLLPNSYVTTIDLPAEAHKYYVIATNKTGLKCTTISEPLYVKENDMKVTVPESIIIDNGDDTTITATVNRKDVNVSWVPTDKILNGKNDSLTIKTVPLQSRTLYTITVIDSLGCSVSGKTEVIVVGGPLVIQITEPDMETSVDTVRICDNELLKLYALRDGGNGTYKPVKWYDGNKEIVADSIWLSDYDKNASGYIYLEVTSAAFTGRDSVYVELLDTFSVPVLSDHKLECLDSSIYEVNVSGLEAGVNYMLEYNKLNVGTYKPYGDTVSGDDGSSHTFTIDDLADSNGYYRLKVFKNYNGKVCATYGNPIELRLNPKDFDLTKDNEYCYEANRKDTIRMAGSQKGVDYTLIRVPDGDKVATAVGTDSVLNFIGAYGEGTYKVLAKSGSCERYMSDSVKIEVHDLPVAKVVAGKGEYCLPLGSEVSIGVNSASAGVTYELIRIANGVKTHLDTLTGPGNLNFGEFSEAGEYHVLATEQAFGCETVFDEKVNIGEAPQDFEVEGGNEYLHGESPDSTTVKIHTTIVAGVIYELYNVNDAVNPVGTFGNYNNDTLYYKGVLPQGSYIVKAHVGNDCKYTPDDTVLIKAIVKEYCITGDTLFCNVDATSGVMIGIDSTQTGVKYILQKYDTLTEQYVDVDNKVIEGTGYSANFVGVFKDGDYRIVADNGTRQLMCGVLRVRKEVMPDPKTIVSIDGEACVDSAMTIKIATELGVDYVLYFKGSVTTYDTLNGTGGELVWNIPDVERGTFRISADNGKCEVMLNTSIETGEKPTIGTLEGVDSLCANVKGELYLTSYDPSANNILYNLRGDTIAKGGLKNNKFTFAEVGPGTYYAVAAIGMCEVRSNDYKIDSITAVELPSSLQFEFDECVERGEGSLRITGLSTSQTYYIKGGSLGNIEFTSVTDTLFENLAWGEYCLSAVEEGSNCPSLDTCITLKAIAPTDTLINSMVYCEEEEGVRLKLSAFTYGGVYSVYDTAGNLVVKNTSSATFAGTYEEGIYILENTFTDGIYPTCKFVDTFEIVKRELPLTSIKPYVVGGGLACSGDTINVGLDSTEIGIMYILRKVTTSGNTDLDTIYGNGASMQFDASISEVAKYSVYAQIVGTSSECGVILDEEISIKTTPADVSLTPCFLCGDEGSECDVETSRLQSGVQYIIYSSYGIALDTLLGPGKKTFSGLEVGDYYVIATDTTTGCFDTMSVRPSVTRLALPVKYTLTSACDTASDIDIEGSDSTVNYILYRGNAPIDTLAGTGSALSFDRQNVAGVYKVRAEVATNCGVWLTDSVIIYESPLSDTLLLQGEYCDETSTVKIALSGSVRGWTYTLSRNGFDSQYKKNGTGSTLIWDAFNKGVSFVEGAEYVVSAKNTCKTYNIDTIIISAPVLPSTPVHFIESSQFCQQEGFSLTLDTSVLGVEYTLILKDIVNGKERPVEMLKGTGDSLRFVENYLAPGNYILYANFTGSVCKTKVLEKTMSVVNSKSITFLGEDVCLATDGSGEIRNLQIGNRSLPRDNDGTYYLYLNNKSNIVDAIYPEDQSNTFAPQSAKGCYGVYFEHTSSGCVTDISTMYCLNEPPNVYDLESPYSGDTIKLCLGDSVCLKLSDSDTNTRYRIVKNGDPYGSGNNWVKGTGNELKVGCVNAADGIYLTVNQYNGTYRIEANNGCQVLMNDSIMVKFNVLPSLVPTSADFHYCEGGEGVNVTLMKPSDDNITYSMEVPEGTMYPTEVDGKLVFETLTDSGYYRITAVNSVTGCEKVDSVKVVIDSLPVPFVLTSLPNEYICVDGSVTLKLAGSESGVKYTLFKDGEETNNVRYGTGNALNFTNIREAGRYRVRGQYQDTYLCERDMYNFVDVKLADTVDRYDVEGTRTSYCYSTTEPEDKGIITLLGSTEGVEYELYADGVATGKKQYGTGEALVWSELEGEYCEQLGNEMDDEDSGVLYSIWARDTTSNCMASMKGSFYIVIETYPNITYYHPSSDIEVCEDSLVNFSVIANGCRLHYDWLHRGFDNASIDTVKSGSEEYLVYDAVKYTDLGYYWVSVSNTCGTDETQMIRMNVNRNMEIKPNRDAVICNLINTTVNLESILYGKTYTWYKANEPEKILGTKAVLQLSNLTEESAGKYVCVANNGCYTLIDTLELRIGDPTKIRVLKGDSTTLCIGSSFELQLEIGQKDTVAWLLNGLPTGATGAYLHLNDITKNDAGHYSVRVSGQCSEYEMAVADLAVQDTIKVIRHTPNGTIICPGEDAELFIETEPSEGVEYLWEYKGETIGTEKQIKYGNLDTNYVTNVFRVTFSNACKVLDAEGKDMNYREITLLATPTVSAKDPIHEIVACAGEKPDTLIVLEHNEALGVKYEWHFYSNTQDTIAIPRATSTDSIRINLQPRSNGYYFCVISNGCDIVATNATYVKVDSVPVIREENLTDTTLCEGEPFMFKMNTTGGSVVYTWVMKNKEGIVDTIREVQTNEYVSSDSLEIPYLSMDLDSVLIWCSVYNHCDVQGTSTDTMLLRINPLRTATFTSPDTLLCDDEEGVLVVELTTGTVPWGYSYITPDMDVVTREPISNLVDTLHITKEGTYLLESLWDATGCVNDEVKGKVTFVRRESSSVEFSGGGKLCAGSEGELDILIKKGVGPWTIKMIALSDVTSIMSPVKVSRRDTTINVAPEKDTRYKIYEAIDLGTGCEASVDDSVVFDVKPLDYIQFVTDRADVGTCADVDIRELLQPSIGGVSLGDDGDFYVNGVLSTSERLLQSQLKPNTCYTVECRYVDDYACSMRSEEVQICVDTMPYGGLTVDEISCWNEQPAYAKVRFSSAVDYVKIRETTWKQWNNAINNNPKVIEREISSTSSTPSPVYTLDSAMIDKLPSDGTFMIPLNWNSIDSPDSCKIFEIVSMTDKYGCTFNVSTAIYKSDYVDTVYYHTSDKVEYWVRSGAMVASLGDTNSWQYGLTSITIAAGDSVEVKARLVEGEPSWSMPGIDLLNEQSMEAVKALYPTEDTTYNLAVSDDICGESGLDIELKVSIADTGYISARLWLEGPYDTLTNLMVSNIATELGLPSVGSLKNLPRAFAGEHLIDFVKLEVRRGKSAAEVAGMEAGTTVVTSDSCLLLSNGYLLDLTGDTLIGFAGMITADNSSGYIVVSQRNHLEVMTAKPIEFRAKDSRKGVVVVDFSNDRTIYDDDHYLLNNMTIRMVGGKARWMLSAGELHWGELFDEIENELGLSASQVEAWKPKQINNNLITVFDANHVSLWLTGEDATKSTALNGILGRLLDVNFDGDVDWPTWNSIDNRASKETNSKLDWDIAYKNMRKYSLLK